MTQLSTVLKQRRKELGLTLAQIADAMGVSEATVQRWESGNIKSIRYDKISKLADILKINPSAIMGWEGKERSEPETDSDLEEITNIFKSLNPDNRAKLLELSRLYLDAQHKKEQTP